MSLLLIGIAALPLCLCSSPQPLLLKYPIPILSVLLRSLSSFQNALIVLWLHRSHPRSLFEGLSLPGRDMHPSGLDGAGPTPMWTSFSQHGQNPHNDRRGAPPKSHILCQVLYLFHHIGSPSNDLPERGPYCCPMFTGGN